MKRNVKCLFKCSEGDVIKLNMDGKPFALSYNSSQSYLRKDNMKLILSFNHLSGRCSYGDCIIVPAGSRWGAFEADDGIVLMRFSQTVGWVFWGGTYRDGYTVRTVVTLESAIRFKPSEVNAVLAILNVDKKETVDG